MLQTTSASDYTFHLQRQHAPHRSSMSEAFTGAGHTCCKPRPL